MAKITSYKEIIDNSINKQQLSRAEEWWGTLDYKRQNSRIKRHFPYAVIMGDADLIYLFRVGRNKKNG